METRANYVLIGSFVMLAAAALVMFAVWVSRVQFNREFAMYDVVFEGAVNGLSEGGEVRFNGIKVGEVTNLALDRRDPNNVIARIRVDAQTPVREDSKAVLDFMGITGVTFIQIDAGDTQTVFGEDQARYLIACNFDQAEALMIAAGQAGVTVTSVGRFTGDSIRIGQAEAPLSELAALYRHSFAAALT